MTGDRALPTETQVLIAGGGPVGLATAIELGRRGIDCLVVEPRRQISHARPRCKTVSVRTMEHMRRWGLAERFRALAPLPVSWSQDVAFCTSLAGYELARFHGAFGLTAEGERFAELGQQAPQYVLEELLREAAAELPRVTLATGMRLDSLAQDDHGVGSTIVADDGTTLAIGSDYVVGCDGPRSVARAQIGSAYVGETALRPNFGMVFRAPGLLDRVAHAPAVQYWVVDERAPSMLGPIDLHGTWWMIAFGVEAERGQAEGRGLIERAIGAAAGVEVLSTDPWIAHMQQVDRAAVGRVFLAGDAAHLNPPFGGHGLNTGVGDSVDLGWKLAATLAGWGGGGLLDSYAMERRPVQQRVIAEATANMSTLSTELLAGDLDAPTAAGECARAEISTRILAAKDQEFHSLELVLDHAYADSPVIASGGGRLPHAWLDPGVSIYDRLGAGMTVLALSRAAAPAAATLARACEDRRVPVTLLDLSGHGLRDRYGHDLLLVRPDQHVAWRGDTPPADPARLIDLVRGAI